MFQLRQSAAWTACRAECAKTTLCRCTAVLGGGALLWQASRGSRGGMDGADGASQSGLGGPGGKRREPRDAVLVFGSTGKLGRLVVQKVWHPPLLNPERTCLGQGGTNWQCTGTCATHIFFVFICEACCKCDWACQPVLTPLRFWHLLSRSYCTPSMPWYRGACLVHAGHSIPESAYASQLIESGRSVVAAARSTDRAADVFSDLGIAGSPHLFVRSNVDVTDASSLPDDILSGVTQIVSALGPVFGRTAKGQMG